MSSFDDLAVGDRIDCPSKTVVEGVAALMIGLGGYTHPMFNDHQYIDTATPFDRPLIPGEMTLFFLGGLAEQSGIFDETTVALVGIDDVRFKTPVLVGDTIAFEMEVVEKKRSERHGTVTFAWRCHNQEGQLVLQAKATLLFRVGEDGR